MTFWLRIDLRLDSGNIIAHPLRGAIKLEVDREPVIRFLVPFSFKTLRLFWLLLKYIIICRCRCIFMDHRIHNFLFNSQCFCKEVILIGKYSIIVLVKYWLRFIFDLHINWSILCFKDCTLNPNSNLGLIFEGIYSWHWFWIYWTLSQW